MYARQGAFVRVPEVGSGLFFFFILAGHVASVGKEPPRAVIKPCDRRATQDRSRMI